MARKKNVADAAKAKAEKQKKIAIGLIVLLALAGAYAVHTMMSLNSSGSGSKPVAADTTGSTVAPAPAATTPAALPAAPTLSGALPTDTTATPGTAGSTQLIDSVQASAGTGQLKSFSLFESKDPFNAGGPGSTTTGTKSGGSSSSGGGTSTSKPPKTPPAPPSAPTPAPSSAVISVNGTSESVSTGSNFPAASPVFQLLALTATTAKVAVAGGSYANGDSALTLKVNTPVTLVNTADGTRYTLTLLPPGTAPSAAPTAAPASPGATTPASTTPLAGG